jgi:hypothetical protein
VCGSSAGTVWPALGGQTNRLLQVVSMVRPLLNASEIYILLTRPCNTDLQLMQGSLSFFVWLPYDRGAGPGVCLSVGIATIVHGDDVRGGGAGERDSAGMPYGVCL